MRTRAGAVPALLVALALAAACGGGGSAGSDTTAAGEATATTTAPATSSSTSGTDGDLVAACEEAASIIGAMPPSPDRAAVAFDAVFVSDYLRAQPPLPDADLTAALADTVVALDELSTAAAGSDEDAYTAAAQAALDAYATVETRATALGTPECGAASWGSAVAVAASGFAGTPA